MYYSYLMRKIFKIFSILSVLYILSFLFIPSVKATCSYDKYGNCAGTCSCPAGYCGGCSCVVMYGYCTSYSNCHSCPTSTSAPLPTKGASPTLPAGCSCGTCTLSCCHGGPGTPVCNCTKGQWQCTGTGGSCTTWSSVRLT